jgi:hypothetical protein
MTRLLLNQKRVPSRRKPSLLCLRLKLAKQGCFHPRDVLPKQSTASTGFRMAARPLGQWITGDPRSARVHRHDISTQVFGRAYLEVRRAILRTKPPGTTHQTPKRKEEVENKSIFRPP